MKRIIDTILGVGAAFVVSLSLNATINYINQPKGDLRISPTVAIQGQLYVPVSITNFSSTPINGLILSIPKSVNISGMVASNPTQINPVPDTLGFDSQKRVEISGLEPQKIIILLVPLAQQFEANLLQPVNYKQLGFGYEKATDIENPLINSLSNAIVGALLYSLVLGVGYYWLEGYTEREFKRLSQEQERIGKRLDDSQKELARVEKGAGRMRIILLSQLSDYSKELDFWRDTIRKILYQTTHDKKISETIIEQVTENLKTYAVREQTIMDFETAKAMAQILSKSHAEDSG